MAPNGPASRHSLRGSIVAENQLGPLAMKVEVESWPLAVPFRITGHTFELIDVLVVSLRKGDCLGRGEAVGVYYRNDTPSSMLKQIEALRIEIELGISRGS